ncbi:hypothetical protein H4S02_005565, partial [Coemansia sp. RSA 2611]
VETANAALAGFIPYESDPAKRSRYLEHLAACASSEKDGTTSRPVTLSAAEASEFARMAQVFKPNTVMMSRFTSSRATAQTDPPASDSKTEQGKNTNSSAKRVDATRTTLEWTPARLLCKRMNIPPPCQTLAREKSEKEEKEGSTKQRRVRAADFIVWDGPEGSNIPAVLANDTPSAHLPGSTSAQQKPDLSLFQSIFGDSE